jgi:hypothetical protein
VRLGAVSWLTSRTPERLKGEFRALVSFVDPAKPRTQQVGRLPDLQGRGVQHLPELDRLIPVG